MMYHTAGVAQFHEGFTDSMEDDASLRPPLALQGLKDLSPESIKKYLSDSVLKSETAEEAEEMFERLLHFSLGSAPKYPDKTAVHFTAETVADDYYGGEQGNEVFYIYPADFLASQHSFAFNGWEKDFTQPQSEKKWNDVFIWPNQQENKGININAGIVFLPNSTQVDPETGSKYHSVTSLSEDGEKREMVPNQELVDRFISWAEGLENNDKLMKIFRSLEAEEAYASQRVLEAEFQRACSEEIMSLGVDEFSSRSIADKILSNLLLWGDEPLKRELFVSLVEALVAIGKELKILFSPKNIGGNIFLKTLTLGHSMLFIMMAVQAPQFVTF